MREQQIKKRTAAVINQAAPVKPEIVNPCHFQAPKKHPLKTIFILIMAIAVAGTAYSANSHMTAPEGKAAAFLARATTSRVNEIEGSTKNIPPSRRYIWIRVDVQTLGLSWPKRQVHKFNKPFKTKIFDIDFSYYRSGDTYNRLSKQI